MLNLRKWGTTELENLLSAVQAELTRRRDSWTAFNAPPQTFMSPEDRRDAAAQDLLRTLGSDAKAGGNSRMEEE